MTPAAKEWGITLLRLWIGFLVLWAGLIAANQAFRSLQGLPSLFAAWKGSGAALASHLIILIKVLGGAGILAGIAVRICAFFTAAAYAYLLWEAEGLHPGILMAHPVHATIIIASLAFLLTGPGMLNLGRVFQKKR